MIKKHWLQSAAFLTDTAEKMKQIFQISSQQMSKWRQFESRVSWMFTESYENGKKLDFLITMFNQQCNKA